MFQSDPNDYEVGFSQNEASQPALDSMGEQPLSIRQLLKQYRPLQINAGGTNNSDRFIVLSPWVLPTLQWVGSPAATVLNSTACSDMWVYLHAPFAYFRGGVRLRVNPCPHQTNPVNSVATKSVSVNSLHRIFCDWSDWSMPLISSTSSSPSWANALTSNFASMNRSIEPVVSGDVVKDQISVQCPYQARRRACAVRFMTASRNTLDVNDPKTVVQWSTDGTAGPYLSRAAADDYQLLCWLGVPAMSTD